MPSAIKAYQRRDFYVPHFEIIIGRQSLAGEVIRDIIQVSYKDNIKDVSSFEITINNWDADKRTFKYSGSKRFLPGSEVDLMMGYRTDGKLTGMIFGKIANLRTTFPAGGQPTLTISGVGPQHEFRGKQASHVYEKMTDSEVAREIAARLGADIVTDPNAESREERIDYLLQDNQYDIVFLMERAKRIGYEIYLDRAAGEKTIYFAPSLNGRQRPYELDYGKSLIEFQPNLDTANQVAKVTVNGWDSLNKQKISHTVTRQDITIKGVNWPELEEAFKDREEVVSDIPVHSVQEAATVAREFLQKNAKEMIKGSGKTVGFPELKAGAVVHIGGLDELFSGRYFVTATTHTIGGSGYSTQFECRREEL